MIYGTWSGGAGTKARRIDRNRPMERYHNWGGNSNVLAYAIDADAITVKFASDNSYYLYDYKSAGRDKVERMKSLARGGRGLNSFIMLSVKYGYAEKTTGFRHRD
jgi:hypothetical protein